MNRDSQTASDEHTPTGLFKTLQITIRRHGLDGGAALFLMLRRELRRFLSESTSAEERSFRKDMIRRFSVIQKKVQCAHSPYQFVLMAKYIFSLKIPGAIVQCGCFKGGSTAKLSILADRMQRKLYVCDSFAGLPKPDSEKESLLRDSEGMLSYRLSKGEYCGLLDEVRENVRRYGCLGVCEFVPGFFSQTLPQLDISPAFVFIDVDLVSSGRDCLKYLWPRLQAGGYFFTHEALFLDYINGILDPAWWRKELGEQPPLVIGAGTGLSPLAPSIAYFQKTGLDATGRAEAS